VEVVVKKRSDIPTEVKTGQTLTKETVNCINLTINGELETIIFDSEAVYKVWLEHIRKFTFFKNYRDFYETTPDNILTPYALEMKFKKKNTSHTYRWARVYEKKQLNSFPDMAVKAFNKELSEKRSQRFKNA